MQDKEIIRQIQKGHKELLRDVIEKYYDEILRFCIYQIKDPAYAYDLTQETFYRFIRCVDTYQYKNLKGYLIAIARNLCVNYWHGTIPEEPLIEEDSLPEDHIFDIQDRIWAIRRQHACFYRPWEQCKNIEIYHNRPVYRKISCDHTGSIPDADCHLYPGIVKSKK